MNLKSFIIPCNFIDSGLTMMNTAVTAAMPDEVRCFFPDCEEPAKDGWAYKVPKNCKLIFNSVNC